MQDGVWLGLFGVLCVGIGGLLAACGRAVTEVATTPAASGGPTAVDTGAAR